MTIQEINMSLAGFVIGLFLLMVWIEYDGSLVDDVARWLERYFKEEV